MMDEMNNADKMDDVILHGFRFHPTDEELVRFYLKRKIQQRSLPVELIKHIDIYKYDPWELLGNVSSSLKPFLCHSQGSFIKNFPV